MKKKMTAEDWERFWKVTLTNALQGHYLMETEKLEEMLIQYKKEADAEWKRK